MSELNVLVDKIKQRWPQFTNATESSFEKPTPQILIQFLEFFIDDILNMTMEMTETEIQTKYLVPPPIDQLNFTATEVYIWFVINQLFRYQVTKIKLDDIIQPAPMGKRIRSLLSVCIHFLGYVNAKVEDNTVYDLFDKWVELDKQANAKKQLVNESNELAEAVGLVEDGILQSENKVNALDAEYVENMYYEMKVAYTDLEVQLKSEDQEEEEVEAENLHYSEEQDRLQAEVVDESTVKQLTAERSDLTTQKETYQPDIAAFLESIRQQKEYAADFKNTIKTVSKLELQPRSSNLLNKELKDLKTKIKEFTSQNKCLEDNIAAQEVTLQKKQVNLEKLTFERVHHRARIETDYLKKMAEKFEQNALVLKRVVQEYQEILLNTQEAKSGLTILMQVFHKEYQRILMSQNDLFDASQKYKNHFFLNSSLFKNSY